MNKNDFRVQIPLWNIALLVSLLICSYGVIYAIDMLFNDFDGVFVIENNEVLTNLNMPAIVSLLVGLFLLIVIFIAYLSKLSRHNKENPTNQIAAFTIVRLGEFMEDDEMLRQVTQNATQKVYILYSLALPLSIFLMFLPLNRYIFIVSLVVLLILHHTLYYREMRMYINGKYSMNQEISPNQKVKNDLKSQKFQKGMIIFSVVFIVLILTISTVRILLVKNNSDANMIKMEKCMDQGGTIIYENESLFSLSKVTCEEN